MYAKLFVGGSYREIEITKQNQRTANALMMESYDKYLHHLWDKAQQLEFIKQEVGHNHTFRCVKKNSKGT